MKRMLWNCAVVAAVLAMVFVCFVGTIDNTSATVNEDFTVAASADDEVNPDIVVGNDGEIYVAYLYKGSSYAVNVARSTNGGGTFTSIGSFTLAANAETSPKLAYDEKDGYLYLAYINNGNLYVQQYTGTVWADSAPIAGSITPAANTKIDIAAAYDGTNKFVAVSFVKTTTNRNIYLAYSVNDGTFTEQEIVTGTGTLYENTAIALNASEAGVFYAAVGYTGTASYDVIVNSFTVSGSEWGTPYTKSILSSYNPSIVGIVYAGDKLYTTYCDSLNRLNVYSATGYGDIDTDWVSEVVVTNTGSPSQPAIYASGSNVFVAYNSMMLSPTGDIFYNFSTDYGVTFTGNDNLVNRNYQEEIEENPTICADGETVYIAWTHGALSKDIMLRNMPMTIKPDGSAFHLSKIRNLRNFDGSRIETPEFPVNDISYGNPYLVMIGNNNIVAINTDNNTMLVNYENDLAQFNSVTVNGDFGIVVGKDAGVSAIWTVDMSTSPAATVTKVLSTSHTDNAWIAGYDTFTDVHYESGKSCFVVGAVTTTPTYHAISVIYDTVPETNGWKSTAVEVQYPVVAITNVGIGVASEYLIITYDSSSNHGFYWLCDGGATGGMPNAPNTPTTIPTIAAQINDAAGTENFGTGYYVYIAATGGIYRMSIDSSYAVPTTSLVPVDGDGGSTEFDYKAVDYASNSIVAVGGINLGAGIRGAIAMLSNAKATSESDIITDAFGITEHIGAYMAVTLKEPGYVFLGGSYEVISSDYYGYDTLTVEVANAMPEAFNFKVDYSTVDYSVARSHGQFEPNGANSIAVWVDIVDPNSLSEITTVKMQAWYDDPNFVNAHEDWPGILGSDYNGVVQITYTKGASEGLGTFTLDYPNTPNNEVTLGACSEEYNPSGSYVAGTAIRLKFVFTPEKQAHYGLSGDDALSGEDVGTWDVQFECDDTTADPVVTRSNVDWEFGYVRVTTLSGVNPASVLNPIAPGADPGNSDVTGDFTITWSSNGKYKVGVKMTTELQKGVPIDTIPATNVLVREAHGGSTATYGPNDWTVGDNIQGQDNYSDFGLVGTVIYWYGSAGDYSFTAPQSGNQQTFVSNYMVYVEYGTMAGTYTADLTYIVDIK